MLAHNRVGRKKAGGPAVTVADLRAAFTLFRNRAAYYGRVEDAASPHALKRLDAWFIPYTRERMYKQQYSAWLIGIPCPRRPVGNWLPPPPLTQHLTNGIKNNFVRCAARLYQQLSRIGTSPIRSGSSFKGIAKWQLHVAKERPRLADKRSYEKANFPLVVSSIYKV